MFQNVEVMSEKKTKTKTKMNKMNRIGFLVTSSQKNPNPQTRPTKEQPGTFPTKQNGTALYLVEKL